MGSISGIVSVGFFGGPLVTLGYGIGEAVATPDTASISGCVRIYSTVGGGVEVYPTVDGRVRPYPTIAGSVETEL